MGNSTWFGNSEKLTANINSSNGNGNKYGITGKDNIDSEYATNVLNCINIKDNNLPLSTCTPERVVTTDETFNVQDYLDNVSTIDFINNSAIVPYFEEIPIVNNTFTLSKEPVNHGTYFLNDTVMVRNDEGYTSLYTDIIPGENNVCELPELTNGIVYVTYFIVVERSTDA